MSYSPFQVGEILDRYAQIDAGEFGDVESLEQPTRHSVHRSAFETPLIFKSDIDFAIDRLGRKGAWLRWCKNIEQSFNGHRLNYKQVMLVRYILGEDVIVDSLIRELSRILSQGDLLS